VRARCGCRRDGRCAGSKRASTTSLPRAQLHSVGLRALAPGRHQQPGIDGSRLDRLPASARHYKALQGTTRHYRALQGTTSAWLVRQRYSVFCKGRKGRGSESSSFAWEKPSRLALLMNSQPTDPALVVHATCQCRTPLATISASYSMTALTMHKLARGHTRRLRAARLSALLCSSSVSLVPSRLASARLMGRSSYFQNLPPPPTP
jgi:hypothetical protein